MPLLHYEKRHELVDGHRKGITKVAFSANRDHIRVATAGLDGCVCVWEVSTGKLLYQFKCSSSILSMVWSVRGEEIIICGLQDGTIACLDMTGVCSRSTRPAL